MDKLKMPIPDFGNEYPINPADRVPASYMRETIAAINRLFEQEMGNG